MLDFWCWCSSVLITEKKTLVSVFLIDFHVAKHTVAALFFFLAGYESPIHTPNVLYLIEIWFWYGTTFLTWCVIVLEAAIRRRVHPGYKGMDMVRNNTVHLNDAHLVLNLYLPEPLMQARMDPCFHAVYVEFWHRNCNSSDQAMIFKPCIV